MLPVLRRTFVCSMLLVPLVACGDGDGDGGMGPEAAATSSVDSALAFGALSESPSSEASLGSALSVYGAAQALNMQARANSATGPTQLTAQALRKAYDPSCAATQGNTTTYTNCEVEALTFNGTASTSGDDITIDITADVDPSAYNGPLDAASGGAGVSITVNSVSVDQVGTLTVTPTLLDGVLNVDVDVSMTVVLPVIGEQTSVDSTPLNIDYDNIVIDNGCATGGTLTVSDGTVTTTATYGPACGDVAVAFQ